MPTYQYACTVCGDRSEVVQRFTDDPLTVCEACGGKLRKVFSPVGIVFKGSGFYRTDSRDTKAAGSGPAKDAGGKDRKDANGKQAPAKDGAGAAASGSSDSGSSSDSSSSSGSSGSSDSGSSGKSGDGKSSSVAASPAS